jgi:hypothetical protein
MRQDMKNFYEVTDIDTSNQLRVEVELVEHHDPIYVFTVNDLPIISKGSLTFDLLEHVIFKCSVTQGAVEIKLIEINGKQVMPIYLDRAEPKTSWITNTWCFEINQPFYPWYHEITGQGWIA